MVVGAFPIVKLGALAIKQLSKPIANQIKVRAKKSHFFRTYICMPPAQFYHFFEVTIKMKMLNLGKPVEVPKLNETMAIELGAELLGESIIFITAAVTLTLEYIRSANKEKEKETAREARYNELYDLVDELRYTVIKQDAEIRHLERVLHNKKDIKLKVPFFSSNDEIDKTNCKLIEEHLDTIDIDQGNNYTNLIFEAVEDAKTVILGSKDKTK